MIELIKFNSEVEIYIKALQEKKQYKKSLAFMDYCVCSDNGEFLSIRENAKRWNVGTTTAHSWIKEFEDIIFNMTN
ncbi:hypothetical protein [Aliarcobacter vitoriensis]|uniref:Uncharacterized protein n=1 Tax=Aliarcobacter vitoriensis TaxID=2011099 RepID=A0A366MTA8_9BACT|nr:hypothetical protein [Aliarcobacter vitoriensis]RBQ28834.1 hypothetical protein CRU91_07520 [Aliarcobacter vitoriensis]